jgi:AcrR family transcriptional regulator
MPRDTLKREQVVAAAIAILDEEGYDALSMRRLAQRLGATAPTLYWHVRNREELLDLVADKVVGEVLDGIGEPHGWRAWMSALARSLRAVLLRHPGVGPIMGQRPTTGANATATLERLLVSLRHDGFSERGSVLAAMTLTGWASGFAVFEARDAAGSALHGAMAELPAPPEGTARNGGAAGVVARLSADEQFDYGLAVLLDGIEAAESRRRADRR